MADATYNGTAQLDLCYSRRSLATFEIAEEAAHADDRRTTEPGGTAKRSAAVLLRLTNALGGGIQRRLANGRKK